MENYTFKINSSGNASQNLEKIKSSAISVTREIKGLATAALGIGSLFAGVSFIKSGIEKVNEIQDSVAKVNAALLSTKGVANLSFKELNDGAEELSGKVLFHPEDILDAQSMLLTFTQIKDKVYKEAIPAILDFATRYKMSTADAALQVGKALNDPEKGLHRLTRMGVVFSAQQEAQIKKFMAINDVAGAQRVMLGELNTEFGGLAEAMTKTDAGKLKMAAKTVDEFKEKIGGLVLKILVGLIPAFNSIVSLAGKLYKWLSGDSTSASIFKGVLASLTAAFITFNIVSGISAARIALITWYNGLSTAAIVLNTLATEGLSAAWTALSLAMSANPIGLIIAAVVGLVIAIGLLWDKCEGFRKVVGGIFGEIAKVVMGVVHVFVNFAKIAGDVFTGHFAEAAEQGKKFINDFKSDFLEGWGDTWKQGSEKAKNSQFKFTGLLGLGKNTKDQLASLGLNLPNMKGGGAVTQSAVNTSALGGASGGLGEAKNIKIDFHSPLMSINVPGGNGQDIVNKAPMTMEMLLRILNNMTLAQGTM